MARVRWPMYVKKQPLPGNEAEKRACQHSGDQIPYHADEDPLEGGEGHLIIRGTRVKDREILLYAVITPEQDQEGRNQKQRRQDAEQNTGLSDPFFPKMITRQEKREEYDAPGKGQKGPAVAVYADKKSENDGANQGRDRPESGEERKRQIPQEHAQKVPLRTGGREKIQYS